MSEIFGEAAMNKNLIMFLKASLEEDEHNVVALLALAPPGQDVLLDSTVPMIDMVRAVADLYAEVEHLDTPEEARGDNAFAAGRAAGLGLAVRTLALTYHDRASYREEWRPAT